MSKLLYVLPSLRVIEYGAFAHNPLAWISPLPDSLERIASRAFAHSSLSSVRIGRDNQLKTVSQTAFAGSPHLKSVMIPVSTVIQDDRLRENETGQEFVPYGCAYNCDFAFICVTL
jgi:hypothetical protein